MAGSTATVTQAATPDDERTHPQRREQSRVPARRARLTWPACANVRRSRSRSTNWPTPRRVSIRRPTPLVTSTKSSTNVFVVTADGTTAAARRLSTRPTSATARRTVRATVKFIGTTGAFTVADDYLLNAASGRIGIEPDGDIAAYGLRSHTEVTGDYLSLNVDYTPAAETRDRTTTSGSGSIAGSSVSSPTTAKARIATCSSRRARSRRTANYRSSVTPRRHRSRCASASTKD